MIKVLRNLVLIDIDKTPSRIGSLYIPETARKNQDIGIIVAFGEDANKTLKVGERVLFDPFAGFKMKDEETEKEYLCIKDEDIIAHLED